jgi:flagellar hook protein FlgE
MTTLHDDLKDLALNGITGSLEFHLCSSNPANRAAVTSTTLGNKASPVIGSVSDSSSPAGRKRTIAAISDGTVTTTGTATHWAIIDGTKMLASGSLGSSQALAAPGTFTTDAADIVIEDAVSL